MPGYAFEKALALVIPIPCEARRYYARSSFAQGKVDQRAALFPTRAS